MPKGLIFINIWKKPGAYYIFYIFVYKNSLQQDDLLERGKKIIFTHAADSLSGHITLRGLVTPHP